MTRANSGRRAFWTTVGVVTAAGLLATSGDAQAGRRRKKTKPAPDVVRLQTPLGLQGVRGAGNEVVVPFSLVDKRRRKADVDVEFGVDRDGDGVIADGSDPQRPSEYLPATEDRRDSRNTRKNKRPELFTTAGDIGASHAFVWSSAADISTANYPTLQFLYSPEGRPVPDPNNPGSFLFADTQPGVKIRVRGVSKTGDRSAWVYTDNFALNNNTPPSMTIDSVIPNATSNPTASDEVVEIRWTAYDDDSEDLNGNGGLDLLELEDINGNGVLDPELVAVAFDYWRVPDGVDATSLTADELDALLWKPCTRANGFGDPSDGVPSAPEPFGRQHSFAWDSVTDVGTVHATFILRARPFDQKQETGSTVYFTQGFVLDNWKVFNSPGAASTLPGGRVGATVVNMTAGLPRSDPDFLPPRQSVLVTGGASQADGQGTNYLALMIVNTETSETTTASAAPFTTLLDARSYHTATVLDDGRVLLTGGFSASGTPLVSTEIYDPVTHTTSSGADLLVPRAKHTAVKLANGDVAIFGGISGSGVTATAEIFHVVPHEAPAEPAEVLADLPVAQHSAAAVLLADQRVLVTGGIDAAGNGVQAAVVLDPLFDSDPSTPATKNPTFTTVGPMLESRPFASFTPLIDGNVLVAGGGSPAKNTLELFNATTGTFEAVSGTMPQTARAQHLAVRLGDGSVLLAGGTTNPAGGTIIADADVVAISGSTGSWAATFLPVNGDMRFPRRGAAATAINNGRVMIVGGLNATGGALAELETFTPENGANGRPSARTDLESRQQSWAFGAPIVYRVTDPEGDAARVVVQWSDNGGVSWNAAAPQATTIGGDVAEFTAPVSTGVFDNEGIRIDPISYPTSDHKYIWSMLRDIPRPTLGPPDNGKSGPFIFRTIPYAAVQGNGSQSVPVTVLYNTKVIPTIIPLESRSGVAGAAQGGDINIWVHLRDIDGPGTGPRSGDAAAAVFEYAVDTNQDGSINDGSEFWFPMSHSGAGVDPSQQQNNYLDGLATWSEAAADSNPEFDARDPAQGWSVFPWDSVFDLGAPSGPRGDVWVRVRPFDNLTAVDEFGDPAPDEGFTAVLRNEPGQPQSIVLVRDPEALWLSDFRPLNGNPNSVAVNEPIDLVFNGIVDPSTISTDTIQVRRNGAVIEGVFTVTSDVPSFTSTVRFFPQLQSTNLDAPVYTEQSNPTVLFPSRDYTVTIPGYVPGTDPRTGTTLRPANAGYPTITQTYLLAQNVDRTDTFLTNTSHYDDGTTASATGFVPAERSTLAADDDFSVTLSKAVDVDTVKDPNLTVTINNVGGASASRATAPVVPGQWTVTNLLASDGSRTSTLTFVPLLPLPSGATVEIDSNSGLLTSSGRAVATIGTFYTVDSYGRIDTTLTETFANTNNRDTANTTASWGTDECAPGALTGLQDSATQPQGGNDLTVGANQTVTISSQVSDYGNITVQKGGTLRVRVTAGAATIRATGNIRILGTVDFSGEDGWTGHYGNATGATYYLYTTRSVGTRQGGTAYNGGGGGGDSESRSSPVRRDGDDGAGPEAGEGGQQASLGADSYYTYGAGGGAGGGHGQPGREGGRATNYYNRDPYYGPQSIPGGINGDRQFLNGISVGSGGGGGAVNRYSSVYYHNGGGGGAGAGAVAFLCDGEFEVAPSGYIDGRGGRGGSSGMLAGSGGGGSGGGLHIKSGGVCTLDGMVDLRGGKGGPAAFSTWSDFYTQRNAFSYGTARHGGDGGGGRLVVEAPNFLNYDDVRVKGQLMIQQVTTLPTSSVGSASTAPSVFTNGGSINYGSSTEVRYQDLIVPAGRVVTLAGTKAVRIFVDGDVRIDGVLRLNGNVAPKGFSGNATSPMAGTAPRFDGGSGTPSTAYVAAPGTLGGGNGGLGHTIGGSSGASNDYKRRGGDGAGPVPGKNFASSSSGYAWSGNNYIAFTGDVGGGGAGSATEGDLGWAPYAISGRYDYSGAVTDSTGDGRDPDDVVTDSAPGGKRLDPSNISVASLDSFVGSGGGGGNLGGYTYSPCSWNYFGMTGHGGSGAGGFAIVGSGTVAVNGTIEAVGGDGTPPGAGAMSVSVWDWSSSTRSAMAYMHSGGGGGSGGTIYIVGDEVTVAAATSETSGGATFDLKGGMGGGWRQYDNRGVSNRYPSYNSLGNFGGDGGYGRLVINYRTSLNNGRTLFNRYGMEQTVYEDSFARWTSLSGSAYAACRGLPGGNTFQSSWYDLGSITPVVNGVDFATTNAASYTLQGEGAQSLPHAVGTGTGAPDSSNTSGFQTPGTAMLDGWRWFHFKGTLARATTNPSDPPPTLDDLEIDHRTDDR